MLYLSLPTIVLVAVFIAYLAFKFKLAGDDGAGFLILEGIFLVGFGFLLFWTGVAAYESGHAAGFACAKSPTCTFQ